MEVAREATAVKSIVVLKKMLLGIVARWAVQQSPYTYPAGLTDVLDEVGRRFDARATDEIMRTRYVSLPVRPRDAIRSFIQDVVIDIPQVQAWNQRKNGNTSPLKFASRYDLPGDPDDDFIDLGALATNIEMALLEGVDDESRVTYLDDRRP